MPYILFLDDSIDRKEFWRGIYPNTCFVSTSRDCIQELNTAEWDYVFLDHDLGEGEPSGMDVVKYLEGLENPSRDTTFIIHSWNTPASIEMNSRLMAYGYNSMRIPFSFNIRLNND